jgi:hypothetical protein
MKKCLYVGGDAEQINAAFFKRGDDPLGSLYYVQCVSIVLIKVPLNCHELHSSPRTSFFTCCRVGTGRGGEGLCRCPARGRAPVSGFCCLEHLQGGNRGRPFLPGWVPIRLTVAVQSFKFNF